jgi:hypothetical protein
MSRYFDTSQTDDGGGSILWSQKLTAKPVAKIFRNKISPFISGAKWYKDCATPKS